MVPKFFKLSEFLHSQAAKRYGIENFPSWKEIDNLKEFACILDGIREEYGKPVYISSGFRVPLLNKAVGGVNDSNHQYGWTADLQVGGDIREFADFVKKYLESHSIKWDELIFEKSYRAEWLHFAWKGKKGRQRMKCFDIIQ